MIDGNEVSSRYMDPLAGVDEYAVFERAAEIQEKLEQQAMFNATVHGGQSTEKLMEPATLQARQEMTARLALSRAIAEQVAPPRSKGPARHKGKVVNARKRQRQARRGQR